MSIIVINMHKKLVIVESPGKIKKITEYLGSDYIVKASFGHVRDLDDKSISIDIKNNFKPLYSINKDKYKVVNELKDLRDKVSEVILASDEDREGEAIAQGLKEILSLPSPKRIVFHEITKKALQKAVNSPREIDNNMVLAQQARRLLDRLMGYQISPILWKHLQGVKSAGRVQSVAVKILCELENKIDSAISTPYYLLTADFSFFEKNKKKLKATLYLENEEYRADSADVMIDIMKKVNKDIVFYVKDKTITQVTRKPSAPFITSSLQQEASTKLRFSVKKTMDVAQKLYEGGFITYMRTDSTNLSNDALSKCKAVIENDFGEEYYKFRIFKSKGDAQEAHEAIRPTKLDLKEVSSLGSDAEKLYSLIWKRTIASQMADAIIEDHEIKISTKDKKDILPKKGYFYSKMSKTLFPGFLIVYNNLTDEVPDNIIKIEINDIVDFSMMVCSQEYTKPPLRMNEANLVKYLEKKNIGRPSTYASIISKIIERGYVHIKDIDGIKKESKIYEQDKSFLIKEKTISVTIGKENKKLVPTDLGRTANDFLSKHFGEILQEEFTSEMENKLDKIAQGKLVWHKVLKEFYQKFNPIVIELGKKEVTKITNLTESVVDTVIGKDINGNEIYCGKGKYGPYVKIKEGKDWKYASIQDEGSITIEDAIEALKYPRLVGKDGRTEVFVCKGKFGFYLKKGKINKNINNYDHEKITIEEAIKIFATPTKEFKPIKGFKTKNNI